MTRAIDQLGAKGVMIYTNIAGTPLDAPQFQPLFDEAGAGRADLAASARGAAMPDYSNEDTSAFEIWWALGWPYETSAAMARLVFSGIFDRHPNLKIITHHLGGIAPYLEGRVGYGWDQLGARTSKVDYSALRQSMTKRPVDYFRMFHADTAMFGARAATRCGLEFFGAGRCSSRATCRSIRRRDSTCGRRFASSRASISASRTSGAFTRETLNDCCVSSV